MSANQHPPRDNKRPPLTHPNLTITISKNGFIYVQWTLRCITWYQEIYHVTSNRRITNNISSKPIT